MDEYFRGDFNVGLLLGQPSDGLVDVDLDATETAAAALALLPSTHMVHGRASKPHSHAWYVATPAPKPLKLTDENGTCLVELRSTNQMTLVPPSLHPNGEAIAWESTGDPSRVSPQELRRAVGRVGAAGLIARHWPVAGNRHEAAKALAGLLLRADWLEEEAMRFVSAVAQAAGDEEYVVRASNVRSTAHRLRGEGTTTGRTRLGELIGNQIVSRACEWLEIKRTAESSPIRTAFEIHPWPDPPEPEAFHGLAGVIVALIEPHSEADRVALLVQILVAFGNIIGRGPHFVAEGDVHSTNLFAVLVGATSKGRKGSAWSQVQRLFKEVDSAWADNCLKSGLSSGEGLIWSVRDPIERQDPIKKNGRVTGYETVIADAGVNDKRLLVVEPEFASPLRLIGREGNTLSAMVRQAWDSGHLRVLTKHSPAKATGAHVSIIGHITRDELLRYLSATEAGNGFANRFLWMCVRRSKILPEGGRPDNMNFESAICRLKDAVSHARTIGELRRDEEARHVWQTVYGELSEGRPGLLGAVISRAEAQVMRLAVIYAILDLSPEVRKSHLLAALALWDYSEASARFVFADSMGDPVADELIRSLRCTPQGLNRTEIRDLFDRHRTSEEIGRALRCLLECGQARYAIEESGGRPVERWFASAEPATIATEATKTGGRGPG